MATLAQRRADVIAAPFDDAPRIAYADHLDAQPGGPDPRAEFVRVQLRLSSERFDQPPAATAGDPNAEIARRMELLALEQRDKDLLEQYTATWAADILRMASQVRYVRGFVASVVTTAAGFVQYGAWLLQRAPVVYVQLEDVLPSLDALVACPALAGLRALSVCGQGLDDDALRRLVQSPFLASGALWWLELGDNAIGMRGLDHLATAGLSKLRYAGLRGNPVDPHETAGVYGHLIQDVALPPEGEVLEAKHGPLRWLHFPTHSMRDYPPDPHGPPPP